MEETTKAVSRFFKAIKKLLRDPEFIGLYIFVILILAVGTVSYSMIEGWSILDSLYFSTTTLTTIGFGDLYPVTAIGKIFTIIYILVGIGTILGFVNTLAHHTQKENPITKIFEGSEDKKD